MADGSSARCRLWADKLLSEIEWHEGVLKGQTEELRAIVAEEGVTASDAIDCRLVLLDSIDASPELIQHLQEGDHSSKGLYAMGFAIVESDSGYPVTITQTDQT